MDGKLGESSRYKLQAAETILDSIHQRIMRGGPHLSKQDIRRLFKALNFIRSVQFSEWGSRPIVANSLHLYSGTPYKRARLKNRNMNWKEYKRMRDGTPETPLEEYIGVPSS